MRTTRRKEAVEYMQSKSWVCGPSKLALRNDALHVAALPPDYTKSFEVMIKKALREVLDGGKEGFLLLTNKRSTVMSSAATSLSQVGREVQIAGYELEGTIDEGLRAFAYEQWRNIERDAAQRVSLPVGVAEGDDIVDDELLFTGVTPAYPDWHPRHFPMDGFAATRLSTINAIATAVSERIYALAGKRAGGEYSTGFFLADPFEATRSATAAD